MMTNDLIERYIYAVTKRLPSKIKQDVSDELNSLISDMIEERCGEITPTEKDIRVVLTELGTPRELAEKYNPDKDKCLIGSPYYSIYIFVLKIVLICTGIGILMSGIIGAVIENNQFIFEEILNILSMIISGMMAAFAFVTLLFAFFSHKNIKLESLNDSIDNLPPVPKNNKKISKADSIIGIAISVIFAVVFLTVPQIFCVYLSIEDTNIFIPIFNTEAIHSVWYLIVIFAVIGIVRETIKLIDGEYTLRVMLSTIICNVLSGVFSVIWLINDNILNSEFAGGITQMFQNENPEDIAFISNTFVNFNRIFLAVIIFALLADILVTAIGWVTGRKN